MPNTILHKRSTTTGVTPAANSLTPGELAINTADGKVFTKRSDGTVVSLATTGNLSQFASTTSSQLATLISDETGSGALVFGTSPAITTSITTPSTVFDVFNTTATTVNAFGAATNLTIGASTGTTTVQNDLSVSKGITSTEGYKIGSGAINAQTGISYTLLSSDNGKIVTFNNSNAVTVNVPSGLGAGFTCTLLSLGDGKVTLTQSSTTLNWYGGTGNIAIAGKFGSAALVAYSANTFSVSGTLQ